PTPYTLHPTPYTLHTTPNTLPPTPCPDDISHESWCHSGKGLMVRDYKTFSLSPLPFTPPSLLGELLGDVYDGLRLCIKQS
ncbi:hypothetical protein, partial [Nostoc sp. DedQUE07]|uniref:hypothetical protein n=1 Tax=Nostoc sp. DedQUE07 TaxID=3075392 RepID=UPI0039195082